MGSGSRELVPERAPARGNARRIGILTRPINPAGVTPLKNLVDLLLEVAGKVRVVTGNSGLESCAEIHGIEARGVLVRKHQRTTMRVFSNLLAQIRQSLDMIRLKRDVDTWIFFIGGEVQVFPLLAARILRKDVLILQSGSLALTHKTLGGAFYGPTELASSFCYRFSTGVILYSRRHVEEWHLSRYRYKIRIAHRHFVDLEKFSIRKPIDSRKDTVGYIGRMSKEKGVLEFVESYPIVKEKIPGVEFLVVGDGPLLEKVKGLIPDDVSKTHVRVTGWKEHDGMPELLNNLRLLVIPSTTEGLPNIMIESMACGTPVLATAVGGIPDVVKDHQTGFILPGNEPSQIAEGILTSLRDGNLNEVSENSRKYVEDHHSKSTVVSEWRALLSEV